MKAIAKPKSGPSAPFSAKSLSQYRLKRPPHDAALQHTPRLSEEDRADLAEGVALFNVGKYWDAHEAWEKIWQRHQEPWRYFVQGLIQAAAAHHQLQRGVRHGVIKHLHNALVKLEAAPDDLGGLALDEFRVYLHALLDAVETASLERVPPLLQLRFIQKGDCG
jgi:predicted metal-dependent hydrolase